MITTIKTDKLAVTPEQRANLEALAAYLECEPTEYERFSMWDCFAAEEQIEAMSPKERKLWGSMSTADAVELTGTCPTVACALGFGIAAGIRPRLDESWIAYAERCFGAYSDIAGLLRDENEDEDAKTSHRRRLWDFLFSSAWMDVDDTRAGAAAKIRYALDRAGFRPPTISSGWCQATTRRATQPLRARSRRDRRRRASTANCGTAWNGSRSHDSSWLGCIRERHAYPRCTDDRRQRRGYCGRAAETWLRGPGRCQIRHPQDCPGAVRKD